MNIFFRYREDILRERPICVIKMIFKVFKIFENNPFFVQKQVFDMSGCALYSVRLSNGILPCDFGKAETNMILKQARSF